MYPLIYSLVAAACGALIGSLTACVPGLHVYNLLAVGVLFLCHSATPYGAEWLTPLWAACVTSFVVAGNIPAVLLAAPDDSALFTVLPGQKLLLRGRGRDAVLLNCLGAAGGLLFVLLLAAPAALALLPHAWPVLRPHMHWMVWCVITFMLLSEWPRQTGRGPAGWHRLAAAWRSTGAGLLTFALSGLLGLLLFNRPLTPPDAAFQSLMPAFTGLFTLPGLILNSVSRLVLPDQAQPMQTPCGRIELLNGLGAGCLGGAFAALVPAITGGIGGFLAGHATNLRNDKSFLVSQAASRAVYYTGGLMLLFVPGASLCRGGAAAMLESFCEPAGLRDFLLYLGSVALAGGISISLTPLLATRVTNGLTRWGCQRISRLALFIVLALVTALTDIAGLAITTVATGIGLIPPLYGARRMNSLGVILLPVGCALSGLHPIGSP